MQFCETAMQSEELQPKKRRKTQQATHFQKLTSTKKKSAYPLLHPKN